MKKLISVLLIAALCFGLVACGGSTGDDPGKTPSEAKVWFPATMKITQPDGSVLDAFKYELTEEMFSFKFITKASGAYTGCGYPLNSSEVIFYELYNYVQSAFRERDIITVSKDKTQITIVHYNEDDDPEPASTEVYTFTFDDQDRVTQIVEDYKGLYSEYIITYNYTYSDTGYTISYIDTSWTARDDNNVLFHKKYVQEIPFEGDTITQTVTYVYPNDTPASYEDWDTDKLVAKEVSTANRLGFGTSQTIYFEDGTTSSGIVQATFNEAGMPLTFDNGEITATYTYDENGNLKTFQWVKSGQTYTAELTWTQIPEDIHKTLSLYANTTIYGISYLIRSAAPSRLVGPQQFLYTKADFGLK